MKLSGGSERGDGEERYESLGAVGGRVGGGERAKRTCEVEQ